MKLRIALTLITGLVAINAFSGCAYMSNIMRGIANRIEHKQELADIRQETRERLAAERREALRTDSRVGQIESQLCKAGHEALQRQVEAQIKDKVDSQVAFNVSQGLEIGELEVDVEALKKILDEREAAQGPPEAQQKPTQKGPNQKGPFQKSSLQKVACNCDERECGCRPGLWKKFCRKCKHKKCGCEPDCGGPEALRRLAQEPLKKPLRPTEIPLKLPVRLTFGMENPRVLETRVRQEVPPEALRQGPEPLRKDKVNGGPSGGSTNPEPDCPAISTPLPPVPVPDVDARTTSFEYLPFDTGYSTVTRPAAYSEPMSKGKHP